MNAKVLLGSSVVLGLLALAPAARADETPDPCAKLEETFKTDRSDATLEQLAQCREKQGKVASAWSWYADLVSRAVQKRQAAREKAMRQKVAELQKKIPHVTLNLAGRDEIAQIKIDGQPLGRTAWATPLPLDPGEHVFSFANANDEKGEKRIDLKESETQVVEPPVLVADAKAKPAPVETPPPVAAPVVTPVPVPPPSTEPPPPAPFVIDPSLVVHEDGSDQRKWGRIALVGGGVGVALGTVFGVMALTAKNDADDLYASGNAGFKAKDEDASTNAAVATVGFAIGLVGIGVGTYLLVTAKSDRPRQGMVWPTANGIAGRF